MKQIVFILIFLGIQKMAFAQTQTQDEPTSFTYAEFRGGYGVSIFGEELTNLGL